VLNKNACPVDTGNCDFESDDFEMCSWTNDQINSTHGFEWTRSNEIPDAESGFGHFAMASTQSLQRNVGRLISEKLDANNETGWCFQFYYKFNSSMLF
jgi:hypothetical protein